jgi:hypothetical protein
MPRPVGLLGWHYGRAARLGHYSPVSRESSRYDNPFVCELVIRASLAWGCPNQLDGVSWSAYRDATLPLVPRRTLISY